MLCRRPSLRSMRDPRKYRSAWKDDARRDFGRRGAPKGPVERQRLEPPIFSPRRKPSRGRVRTSRFRTCVDHWSKRPSTLERLTRLGYERDAPCARRGHNQRRTNSSSGSRIYAHDEVLTRQLEILTGHYTPGEANDRRQAAARDYLDDERRRALERRCTSPPLPNHTSPQPVSGIRADRSPERSSTLAVL